MRSKSLGAVILAALIVASVHFSPSIAAPPLSTYGKLPGFEIAAMSSSGDHVAIIGIIAGERRLIVLDKENKPLLIMNIGQIKVDDLEWAGDGLVLLTRSGTANLGIGFSADKAELYSTTVIPIDGGKLWDVLTKRSDVTGGIRRNYGLTQKEGRWYGYFSAITLDKIPGGGNLLTSTNPALYEVDLQTGKSTKIANRIDEQEDWRRWLIGSDGTVGASMDYLSKSGDWLLRNGKANIILKGNNKLGDITLIAFGPTDESIIYSEKKAGEDESRWYEMPQTGGQAHEILADVYVHAKIIDPRTRRLIGYEIEGDYPAYHFYNPFHQKVMDAVLKAFPGRIVELESWNENFTRLLVKVEGPEDPGTWQVVDIKSGKADQIGVSYPMPLGEVAPMKMIRYKAQDGLDIEAVLTLPPGREAKNLPVVVMPHGGPAARDYPGFDYWAQAFASRGYAVLQPNFRGSTGYGAAFQSAGDGQWGRAMQTDISDGLESLVKQGIVDAKRACIAGWSYGGYAALAGVTLQQGIYRCAFSMAGVSDVAKMRRTEISESVNNATVIRNLDRQIGSGRDLRTISPINYVDKLTVPVMLVHGKDDTVVLYEQSANMAKALRDAGKTVELITLPNGDHWLLNSETRLQMLEASVNFIEKYNPPDSAKP
jgi:dienelactone hydrolase